MAKNRYLIRKSNLIGIKGKWVVQRIKPSGTLTPVATPSKTKKEASRKLRAYQRTRRFK